MKMYTAYVTNFSAALQILSRCKKRHAFLDWFLSLFLSIYIFTHTYIYIHMYRLSTIKVEYDKRRLADPHSPFPPLLPLGSYLIQPIQRLPRYVMLLQDMIKRSPSSSFGYHNLVNALAQVKHVLFFSLFSLLFLFLPFSSDI